MKGDVYSQLMNHAELVKPLLGQMDIFMTVAGDKKERTITIVLQARKPKPKKRGKAKA